MEFKPRDGVGGGDVEGASGCRVVRAGNVLFQFTLYIYATHVPWVGLCYIPVGFSFAGELKKK
jgi:hypothetical protein